MVILICGFMGAGKSTFLNKLKSQDEKNCDFYDLDHEIFQAHQQGEGDLGQLIDKVGWETFRLWEKQHLESLVGKYQGKDVVISLGGGTLNDQLIEKINNSSQLGLVWLKTPFEVCLNRVMQSHERPLAKKGANYLKDLYIEREKYYQKASICLSATEQDMLWTLQKLKEQLQ